LKQNFIPTQSLGRTIHAAPLDSNARERHHTPLLLMLAGTTVLVFISNVYYELYLAKPTPKTLSATEWKPFILKEKIPRSHDTSLLRFQADLPAAVSDTIPIPSHVWVKDDSMQITRPFTPITYSRDHFDLMVKRYKDGQVSKYLHHLSPGDSVDIRGPIPTFTYTPNIKQNIGMVI